VEKEKNSCKVDIVLGYSQLTVEDLAEILIGMKNWLLRSSLAWSIQRFRKGKGPYSIDNPLYLPLKKLGVSYKSRLRKSGYVIEGMNFDDLFERYLDESVFKNWIREDISSDVVEIETIRDGQSIVVSLVFVTAALLTNLPMLDYSMMKDMAGYLASSLRSAIPHNHPASTLEHLPTVIEKIAKKRTIKKFHIIIEGEKIDIQAEYK
jgi:hypothetical protein